MIERLGVLLVSCPDSAYLARMVQPRLGFVVLFAGLVFDAWRGCWLN